MCNCKRSPFQRVEARIQSRGWSVLSASENALIDAFIHNKLNQYPQSVEERISLYIQAKNS
jgi:hypothetical protein